MKGIKPRIQLVIDLILFTLLLTATMATLFAHILPESEAHLRFMFHTIHGVTGIAMCLTISLHLFLHWPWIKAQLQRLLQA